MPNATVVMSSGIFVRYPNFRSDPSANNDFIAWIEVRFLYCASHFLRFQRSLIPPLSSFKVHGYSLLSLLELIFAYLFSF